MMVLSIQSGPPPGKVTSHVILGGPTQVPSFNAQYCGLVKSANKLLVKSSTKKPNLKRSMVGSTEDGINRLETPDSNADNKTSYSTSFNRRSILPISAMV